MPALAAHAYVQICSSTVGAARCAPRVARHPTHGEAVGEERLGFGDERYVDDGEGVVERRRAGGARAGLARERPRDARGVRRARTAAAAARTARGALLDTRRGP
ncbi:MAG: hypothetical protein ACJ78Z_16095 [Myxococcales bacterium]